MKLEKILSQKRSVILKECSAKMFIGSLFWAFILLFPVKFNLFYAIRGFILSQPNIFARLKYYAISLRGQMLFLSSEVSDDRQKKLISYG